MIKLFFKQYATYFYIGILAVIIGSSFYGGLRLGKMLEQDKYNDLVQKTLQDQLKQNEQTQKIIEDRLKEYAEIIKKDQQAALQYANEQQQATIRNSIRRSIVEGLEKGLKGALYTDPNCEIPQDDLKIINDAIKGARE